jgi:hypothetical protein
VAVVVLVVVQVLETGRMELLTPDPAVVAAAF